MNKKYVLTNETIKIEEVQGARLVENKNLKIG